MPATPAKIEPRQGQKRESAMTAKVDFAGPKSRLPTKWLGFSEMSLDKEKSKRAMIYYAHPEGKPKYGYFSSTNPERLQEFLRPRHPNQRPLTMPALPKANLRMRHTKEERHE
jgi:hypothetical protein